MDNLNEQILRAKELMGIITEQIPGLEDAFKQELSDMDKRNIESRFGEENFMKLKALVDKWGMTQVNNLRDDNSFYMWSKDIESKWGKGDEKLIVFLGTPHRDKPETSNVWVYVDRDGGKSTSGKRGVPIEQTVSGGHGTYPMFGNIEQFLWKGFDRIEPEMKRVEKAFN